jgi:hypothetical protein
MRFLLFALFASAMITVAAQGQAERSSDFSFLYVRTTGTVPPEYYYEYSIEYEGGDTMRIVFRPAYKNVEQYAETFVADSDDVARIYRKMDSAGVFEGEIETLDAMERPVGGSVQWVEGFVDGERFSAPPFPRNAEPLNAVYALIQDLPPKYVWTEWQHRHAEYNNKSGL